MKSTIALFIAAILCFGGITNAGAAEPSRDPCLLHHLHRVIHHIHHAIHRGVHEIHEHLP